MMKSSHLPHLPIHDSPDLEVGSPTWLRVSTRLNSRAGWAEFSAETLEKNLLLSSFRLLAAVGLRPPPPCWQLTGGHFQLPGAALWSSASVLGWVPDLSEIQHSNASPSHSRNPVQKKEVALRVPSEGLRRASPWIFHSAHLRMGPFNLFYIETNQA